MCLSREIGVLGVLGQKKNIWNPVYIDDFMKFWYVAESHYRNILNIWKSYHRMLVEAHAHLVQPYPQTAVNFQKIAKKW